MKRKSPGCILRRLSPISTSMCWESGGGSSICLRGRAHLPGRLRGRRSRGDRPEVEISGGRHSSFAGRKISENHEYSDRLPGENHEHAACMGKNYYLKHLLTFDRILIHFSLDIIDSVVIHELTHHFVQNHSDAFYRILLTYCPDYRRLREKLIYGERV